MKKLLFKGLNPRPSYSQADTSCARWENEFNLVSKLLIHGSRHNYP